MKRQQPRKPSSRPAARRKPQPKLPSSKKRASARRKIPASRKVLLVFVSLLAFVILLTGGLYAYYRSLSAEMNYVDPDLETIPSEYNPPTESLDNPLPDIDGIVNILLLGIDSRDEESIKERSDSMMILTIDTVHGKVKLTSLQRDMLVKIPGADFNKLNSANVFGGPLLTMRVVNETLRLNIERYMVVNMRGMEQLIDLAGGIEIDVEQAEIRYLNSSIREENNVFSDSEPSPFVEAAGLQLLNGRQAVAYARIRKLDSDYKRMERQRIVLQALLNAFMDADFGTKNNMISEGFSLITTNISADELLGLGLNTIPKLDADIEQLQLPISGYFKEWPYWNGSVWVNLCDFNGMIPLLHEFIFEESFEFDPVYVIPGAPNSGVKLATPTPRPTEPSLTPTPAVTPGESTVTTTESEPSLTPTPSISVSPSPSATTSATTTTTTTTATTTTTGTTTATTTTTSSTG